MWTCAARWVVGWQRALVFTPKKSSFVYRSVRSSLLWKYRLFASHSHILHAHSVRSLPPAFPSNTGTMLTVVQMRCINTSLTDCLRSIPLPNPSSGLATHPHNSYMTQSCKAKWCEGKVGRRCIRGSEGNIALPKAEGSWRALIAAASDRCMYYWLLCAFDATSTRDAESAPLTKHRVASRRRRLPGTSLLLQLCSP